MASDDKPFFSVIVPVYNKRSYLRRAVESVLAQAFEDFELILIDDASTDGSRQILRQWTDSRIRVLHRKPPGPGGYAARNLGIREARGWWVAFLDADDEWFPDHLRFLHQLAAEPGAMVCSTGWLNRYDDGRVEPSAFSCQHAGTDILRLPWRAFLEEAANKRTPIWTGVAAADRSLILAVGGFPESCRRGGDVVTWLRLIHEAGFIICSTRRTAVYHRENSGVTKITPLETKDNCVYLACKALMNQADNQRDRLRLMRFSNSYIRNGLTYRRIKGNLRFSDCHFHYLRANPRYHLFLLAYSVFPSWAQKYGFRIYQKSKRLFGAL